MEGMQILQSIAAVLGLAIPVLLLCNWLRVPAIVGLLFTGILAGPGGLGLIGESVEEMHVIAEIGVVLLLFVIGVEFSLGRLLRLGRLAFSAGALQVILTVGLVIGVALFFVKLQPALFLGFVVALSSTAIVLSLLERRAEIDSPHGRIAVAILIFQDLAAVVLMLAVPLLAGKALPDPISIFLALGKGIAIIAAVILLARWGMPRLLGLVVATRSRELFVLTIVVVALAVPWATAKAGLSLALGAFLAGLIISETEYSHQAVSGIAPLRDIFTSLFFISIGMLLDVRVFLGDPLIVGGLTLGVLVFKVGAGAAAVRLVGWPWRTAAAAGLALAQVGEFSFILAAAGLEEGLLSGSMFQRFVSVSILTMAATPFMIAAAPRLAGRFAAPATADDVEAGEEATPPDVLVIGFGVTGRLIARALGNDALSYRVLELNPETVRRERAAGVPIIYGDATQEAVLAHAGATTARVIAVAVPDPAEARRITSVLAALNPSALIVTRTRFAMEVEPLARLGACDVVSDEFEAAVAMTDRVLSHAGVSAGRVVSFLAECRLDHYSSLRGRKGA